MERNTKVLFNVDPALSAQHSSSCTQCKFNMGIVLNPNPIRIGPTCRKWPTQIKRLIDWLIEQTFYYILWEPKHKCTNQIKREAFNSWKFSLVFWRFPPSTQESFLYVSEKKELTLETFYLFNFFILLWLRIQNLKVCKVPNQTRLSSGDPCV